LGFAPQLATLQEELCIVTPERVDLNLIDRGGIVDLFVVLSLSVLPGGLYLLKSHLLLFLGLFIFLKDFSTIVIE